MTEPPRHPNKLDFKPKTVIRDEEGQYIIIKVSIQQEDITIVNICAPNLGAPKYIKQLTTNLKELIDNSTIIVRDFNSPLTAMDNKETRALNDTLDQMNFTDIFRVFHPKATKYTFFSNAYGTFSRIDHILGHKSGLY